MIVYHGSDTFIKRIDFTKSKPNKDFGKGFYVTNIKQQAEEMATRVADSIVTKFEFDEFVFDEEDEDLNILRFDNYSEAWLDFIILNRNKSRKYAMHDYDIVEGPMADDAVSIRIDDYLEGLVSRKDFLEELKFKKHTHQICFCTVRSLQTIKRIDAKPDGIFYHIDDYIVGNLITEQGFSEVAATDLYFTSNTYKLLIDESTKIFQKPWPEIYEIFKQELKKKKR